MKKSLFFILAIVCCISLGAQSYTLKDLKNVTKEAYRTVLGANEEEVDFTPTQRPPYFAPKNHAYHSIGGTHYISATNANARNTISWSPDGSLCAAVWTMGSSGNAIQRRRGTGINYFTQATGTWGSKPSLAPSSLGIVETNPVGSPGWGTHVFTEDGECVVAHSTAAGGMYVNRRNYGETAWDQQILRGPEQLSIRTVPGGDPVITTSTAILWPTMVAVGNTIHMVCVTDNGDENTNVYLIVGEDSIPTCPIYFRSTDGGRTWEAPRTFSGIMPVEDMKSVSADQYVLTARGEHIVLAYARGNAAYIESFDGGNTWTERTVVYNCGDWSWSSEGVNVGPTMYATTIAAAIGDDGVVHVTFGAQMRRRSADTEANYYTFFPAICGMYTWKQGQPLMTRADLNLNYDWGAGEWIELGYDEVPNYLDAPELLGLDQFMIWNFNLEMITTAFGNVGYISHPRLLAQDGKVYLMYSSIVQQPMTYNVGGDQTFFRGVFLTVSHDNGDTYNQKANTSWLSYHEDYFYYDWSDFQGPNATGDGWLGEIEPVEFSENGYPTMAVNIKNNRLVFTWLHDIYPFPDGTPTPVWQNTEFQVFAKDIALEDAGVYNNPEQIRLSMIVNEKIENLKIYPNPVNDRVTIEVGTNAPFTLTITNIMGQVVYTGKGQQSKVTLNVSNYPAGVYVVNVRTANATASQKLIVK